MSCVISLGGDSWKLIPGFFQLLSHVSFPFANFTLYLFAVIYHSFEDYSLLSPPCESLNMGMILGHPLQNRRGGANCAGCVFPAPLSADFS